MKNRGVAKIPQTSKMENFATIINNFEPLIVVAKLTILEVRRGPSYASGENEDIYLCWI